MKNHIDMTGGYETVIGLEVHVELATKTKIFCGCSTAFGGRPNSHVCPVCTGMPGALPVLNRKVLEYAVAVGLACHCEINPFSRFDRKNYFYPDNPQNYQISQLYLPICRNGWIEVQDGKTGKKIGLTQIHMEEDAGKLVHSEDSGVTLIDYNRSGVPLLEIVTEPDMRNADEVISFLEELKEIIQYLGVSDCKLQEGSMRVDVNLSVRKAGDRSLGTRTEMKNLGSFHAISKAIASETDRQISLLEQGRQVVQETRRWDEGEECSYSMRSKEDAGDYRYFPDPDLPPICVEEDFLEQIRRKQPELPAARRTRLKTELGLSDYDIRILTSSKQFADFYERTVSLGAPPKKAANWMIGDTLRMLKEEGRDLWDLPYSPEHLAKLIALLEEGKISSATAKEIFRVMFREDADPENYAAEQGLLIIRDSGLLRETVQKILEENPKSIEDYRNGKERALGFLVGQTMKAMQGRANPGEVKELLSEYIREHGDKDKKGTVMK